MLRKERNQFYSNNSSSGSANPAGKVTHRCCSANEGGTNGQCICPNCGKKLARQDSESCMELICPQCGSQMMKE